MQQFHLSAILIGATFIGSCGSGPLNPVDIRAAPEAGTNPQPKTGDANPVETESAEHTDTVPKLEADQESETTVPAVNTVPEPNASPGFPPTPIEQTELAAYETTVYKLLRTYCVGCHATDRAPMMANPDIAVAYRNVLPKLDLTTPEESRLVHRLKTNFHQCWTDCESDSKTMAKAIAEFKTKLEVAKLPAPTAPMFTPSVALTFASASEGPGEAIDGQYVKYAVDGTITTGIAQGNAEDDIDTSGGIKNYLMTTDQNQGYVEYKFNVTQAGTYTLWGRIKIDADQQQNMSVKMDNYETLVWQVEPETPNQWRWDQANLAFGDPGSGIWYRNLPAGLHTVRISKGAGGTANLKFNRIALTTTLYNYQGGEIVGNVKYLTFPVSSLCKGKNVSIRAEVADFDTKGKLITIRNLRVTTDKPVHIKSIEALINGRYEPLNATFRTIDQAVNPPGQLIMRSAMVAAGQNGFAGDSLSLAFGTCE